MSILLATALAANTVAIGMLPEPNVTAAMLQNDALRIALDLTQEWEKAVPGTTVMQGCIAVRSEFAQAHPDALREFLTAYEASVRFSQENPEQTAALIEAAEILPKAAIAKKGGVSTVVMVITASYFIATFVITFMGTLMGS